MSESSHMRVAWVEAASQTFVARWWPAIVAGSLGVIILVGVGFMPGFAHEAAHDTRHTMAFPCH